MRLLACVMALPLALAAGCATPDAGLRAPQPSVPEAWQAPLPHGGTLSGLREWWAAFDDPTLLALIELGQQASPSISAARLHLEQARAERIAAAAQLMPTIEANASASRGNAQYPLPLSRSASAAASVSWEADLFGLNRLAVQSARAREQSAQAQWHDARVLVAAEVAMQYLSLRHCQLHHALMSDEAASLEQSERVASQVSRAGLLAPQLHAQARALAAAGRARAAQQQAQCEVDLKGLVALTGRPESGLRAQLRTQDPYRLPAPPLLQVSALPAQVVSQRPDVFTAEQNIVAAVAEVGHARALQMPRLSLNGSIGTYSLRGTGLAADLNTWSLGPIRLRVPLFDGGASDANLQAARARFEDATRQYEARIRQAVREVEESLVRLQGITQRLNESRTALDALERALRASEQRQQAGLSGRSEIEEARRSVIDSRAALLGLQREHLIAGVSLYRAAGGGWQDAAPLSSTPEHLSPPPRP